MTTIGIRRLAALTLLLALAAAMAPPATAAKKVTIAIATQVINVTYPWLMMPIALDYWKADGYEVRVVPVGGSLQAVQQLVGGNADFVQINSSVLIQANVKEGIPLRAVMVNSVNDWGLVVLEDSAVRDVRELKSKSIGVPNLASGGIPYLEAYLRSNGLNPESDVRLVAVGAGAPGLEALRSGRVQALMMWAAALAGMENAGAKFRYFRSEEWKRYPDFALATSQKTIDADPAMVEAIARGGVKGIVFANASPECAVKLHWSRWPDTRPTGADDATLLRWDLHNLRTQLASLRLAHELHGARNWGVASTETYGRLQDFMLSAKLIDRKLDPATFVTAIPNFYDRINAFDPAPVKAQAGSCPAR